MQVMNFFDHISRTHNRWREILAEPFPQDWRPWLEAGVPHYSIMTPDEKARLEGDLRIVMTEKEWEGGSGLTVTDRMKVLISAQACLLTLGFDERDYFPNVRVIIVYASAYRARGYGSAIGGIYEATVDDRLGEAHANGPVIISWQDAAAGGSNPADGENVVLHEFAHKLDFGRGGGDGVPRLAGEAEYARWAEVMSAEFQQLAQDVAHGHHTDLRAYGATNAAEFFAVATETFFEKPVPLRARHLDLYDVLKGYYKQDWAARYRTD